jgi:thiol-disulfide isomerase/thioredoxin
MKYFSVNKSALMGQSIYKYLDNVSIVDSMERKHSVYIDGNVRLLEFYFKSCSPCKLKTPVLNQVSTRFKDVKNFKLIKIENGRIDDFNDYTSYLKTNRGITLYDSAGIFSKNLGIDAYPYEIIVDKKGVIRYIFDGFDHSVNNLYYTETINKITTLLNE